MGRRVGLWQARGVGLHPTRGPSRGPEGEVEGTEQDGFQQVERRKGSSGGRGSSHRGAVESPGGVFHMARPANMQCRQVRCRAACESQDRPSKSKSKSKSSVPIRPSHPLCPRPFQAPFPTSPAIPMCTGKRCYWTLFERGPNILFASTTCRHCLQVADRIYS